jgi:hypothetical protein
MKKLIILLSSFALAGCGGAVETGTNNTTSVNKNVPVNLSNTNAVNNNDSGPLAVQTATPAPTTNNAPTLTPVYKAYCAAMEKKDEAALRRIYSTDTIRDFEKKMKAMGIKSLIEYLEDDKASTGLCEVRNEKIEGDTATAEVKTTGYPNGLVAVFVKENGEWKLTNRRPEGSLK